MLKACMYLYYKLTVTIELFVNTGIGLCCQSNKANLTTNNCNGNDPFIVMLMNVMTSMKWNERVR